jgi:hypothetical protein
LRLAIFGLMATDRQKRRAFQPEDKSSGEI